MTPAQVQIPEFQKKTLVLNCSYLPEYLTDKSNLITSLSFEEQVIIDTIITRYLFDGLFSVISESPYGGLQDAEYFEMRTSDTSGFLFPLSPADISDICTQYEVDCLISFEHYSFDMDNYYYPSEDRSYYEEIHELKNNLLWRIYTKDGNILDDYLSKDTLQWCDLSELDCIRHSFLNSGISYGKRISPSWETVYSSLYKISAKTDTGFVRTLSDKTILINLSNIPNRTKSFKACYNLAVLCESENDIDEAISWINRAVSLKESTNASRYQKILTDRLKTLIILDKQTGRKN